MSSTKVARVHADLINAFGAVSKEFADKIKREYNLTELFVPDMLASQIIAGKIMGKKNFNFRVRKTGLNKGVLELL